MKVFLVRHAETMEVDGIQQITPKGREQSAKNALVLKQFHPLITSVYHSAKLRAKQTAEIFHELLCHHAPLEEKEGITPTDAAIKVAHELNSMHHNVMLVSHLPFLEGLSSLLLYGEERALPFKFSNSSIITLEKEGTHWQLIGMISNHCFDPAPVRH
jgi:phosphohistidine phosphatase